MIYKAIDRWNPQCIKHYGVKGMKWGIRHDKGHDTFGRGTKVSRISEERDSNKLLKRKTPMYAYIGEDENGNLRWDTVVYQGPFSMWKGTEASKRNRNINKHDFVVTKDLKMPTQEQRVQEYKKLLNTKNPIKSITYRNNLNEIANVMKRYQMDKVALGKMKTADYRNAKTSDNLALSYRVFNHGMEWWKKYSITKDYMKVMSTKYDAMIDDNNKTIYNRAENPMIIFNANKVLKSIGKSRPITYEEASFYTDFAEKYLKEQYNEEVKL